MIAWPTVLLVLLLVDPPLQCEGKSYKKKYQFIHSKAYGNQLSELAQELWNLDRKYLKFGREYKLNLQGKLGGRVREDRAHNNLFASVRWSEIRRAPSVSEFIRLLDNYESAVGIPERITPEKVAEIHAFLNAVIDTPVMRRTQAFLVNHGLSSPNPTQFKKQLYSIWFEPYKRRRSQDSSAFEHVFVGEHRHDKLLGLHNWIQFALQEAQHKIDYQGYFKTCGTPANLATVSFKQSSGLVKPKTTFLVGTTPAFEMALYTATFLISKDRPQRVHLGSCEVDVICHRLRSKKLGSCYLHPVTGGEKSSS
uniref:Uridylate-specific endoribonuclease n=1 Tax=Echinostoma cinetorchis TaxID=1873862 RepID=A0A3S8Z5R6_9TREM|nr:endoribonuclease RNase H [Echinostoma cinetorchis]